MYHLRLFGALQLQLGTKSVLKGCIRPMQLLTLAALNPRARTDEYLSDILWPNGSRAIRQHSLGQAMYQLGRAAPGVLWREDGLIRVKRDLLTTDLDLIRQAHAVGDISSLIAIAHGDLIPDADRAGVSFCHWVDAIRAEHLRIVVECVRAEFRQRMKGAQWREVIQLYDTLGVGMAHDPTILEYAIRALIYSTDTVALKRTVMPKIELCRKIDRARADRLSVLLKRRNSWDRKAKIHAGPFIGRQDAIRAFSLLLRAVPRGAGFLTCISGPIGIGKSRTAKQFARIAAIRGSRVRVVKLEPDKGHRNYARLLRSLFDIANARQPKILKPQPVRDVAQQIRIVAHPQPVLVIDDVDWLDHSCFELLLELASALRALPLGIVVTAKDTSVVRRLIAETPRGVQWESMQLCALSQEERAQLLDWLKLEHELSVDDIQRVDQLSNGNPANAHRCAAQAHALRREVTTHELLGGERVPDVDRLSPLCMKCVAVAAFTKARLIVRTLATSLSVSERMLADSLQWLNDLGILCNDENGRVECVNMVIGDDIQRRFALSQLQSLTTKIARETARHSPLDAAKLAERAGKTELAARYYFTAAKHALKVGAFTNASTLLTRCSELSKNSKVLAHAGFWQAELHMRSRRYVEAQGGLALLLSRQAMLSPGLLAVSRARHAQITAMIEPESAGAAFEILSDIRLSQLRIKSPRKAAEVVLAKAAVAIVSGVPNHSSTVVQELEAELNASPTNPRWPELAATLCKLKLQSEGYDAALPLSGEYLKRARLFGGAEDLVTSLLTRAIALTAAGELPAAENLYVEVESLLREHGLWGFSHIHGQNYAVALMEMGDIDSAIDRLSTLRSHDNSVRVPYYLAFDDLNLATAHFEQGHDDAAEFFAHEALLRSDAFPNSEFVTALALLGIIAYRRGDHRRAMQLSKEVESIKQRGGDLSYGTLLVALRLKHEHNINAAVAYLLDAATHISGQYRPASLRLRVYAAELQVAVDPNAAASLAVLSAREAAAGGMYSLVSRCAAVLRHD